MTDRAAAAAVWAEMQKESRFFGLGEVRLAVLSLLQDGPNHGYGIMKVLRRRLAGGYKASAGSVYPALKQLEREGLVECRAESGKKVFNLTAAGRRELKVNPGVYRQVWQRLETAAPPPAVPAASATVVDAGDASTSPGDVPTALQGLLHAAYRAAASTVGQPRREAALRTELWQFAARLEAMFDVEPHARRR